MHSQEVIESAQSHPFLAGMGEDHLDMVEDIANKVHFEAGKRVFREGEPADRLYLILKGKVTLEIFNLDQGAIPIQAVGDGEVLGWSWFVPPYRWRFDARAVQPTDALEINTRELLEMCDKHPDFGYDFMKRMAGIVEQRLMATKDQLLDAYVFHK